MTEKIANDDTDLFDISPIRKELGHFTGRPVNKFWLDTGNEELNGVLGSRERGIPYGRIIEMYGWESHGKTALALELAALAQEDGAAIGWVDLENSFDPDWARIRGLDPDRVALIEPCEIPIYEKVKEKVEIKKGSKTKATVKEKTVRKEIDSRWSSAEDLCQQAEIWMKKVHRSGRYEKLFVVVDSIATMMPRVELEAGVTGATMKVNMGLATFVNRVLRRWNNFNKPINATILFINQIRINPGVMFGNPQYVTGGNGPRYMSCTRLRVTKAGDMRSKKSGGVTGIKGVIRNIKNKAGGGSIPLSDCGFKLWATGESEFLPSEEVKPKEE